MRDHWIEALLMALTGCAVATVPFLDADVRDRLYATESSVVERASVVLWVLLAIALPLVLRRLSVRTLAASIVSLAAAAREASLHVAVTDYSVLKIPFYYRAEHPLELRLVVGVIVGAVMVSVAIVGVTLLRRSFEAGVYRARWVRHLGVFTGLLVLSKILDRMPAILIERGYEVSDTPFHLMMAAEEIIELILPILLMVATVAYVRWRRALQLAQQTPTAG